jgi:aminoglycoside phosphotransferase (APT) family kinase protein
MTLTDSQLSRIVAHALPGARLIEAEPLGVRTLRLELAAVRPVVLRLPAPSDCGAGDPLAAEAAALTALRAEVDLPLPELRAYEPSDAVGTPYLLTSYLEGMSLPESLPAMNEDQRYALGRALGELAARAHNYRAPHYGALDPAAPPALLRAEPVNAAALAAANDEDVRYLRARLDAALAVARAEGEISTADSAAIAAWAGSNLAGSGQPASLVHGDLRPERVLVRRRERGWSLGGLTGWGYALAWRPSWDHVAIMEHFVGNDYFSLRVGYGNAYDATTERRYDQLREFALAPFRLILFLEAGRPDLALALLRAEG